MKKLVYLLVLSLCMSSVTGVVPARMVSARAEEAVDSEAEEKARQKDAEEEAARQKEAEEEAARQKAAEEEAARQKAAEEEAARQKEAEEEAARQKAAEEEAARLKAEEEEIARRKAEQEQEEAEKKQAEKEKKAEKKASDGEKGDKKKAAKEENKEDKEQEYTFDLAQTGEAPLSKILKDAKADVHVDEVKKIEPTSEAVNAFVRWMPEEKGGDDYIITVLQDFDEVRLRIETKGESLILILKNGRVVEADQETEAQEDAPVLSEEEIQTEVDYEIEEADAEKTGEGQADSTTGEQSAEEQSTEEQPAGEQTDKEQSTEEQPAGEQTDKEQPAQDQSAEEQPSGDQPAQQQPAEGTQPEGEQKPEEQTTVDPAQGTPVAEAPKDAEAWTLRDGVRNWGTLAELLGTLSGGETVYIQSTAKLFLQGVSTRLLSSIALLPDATAFQGAYVVCISKDDPETVQAPEHLAAADLAAIGETADLYVWVQQENAQPTEGQDQEATAPQVSVRVTDYVGAKWSTVRPGFVLSGIPEGKNWSYTAVIYDERFVPMGDFIYIPSQQGQYSLRFAMLDELGDVMSTTGLYTLWLDWSEPDEVEITVDEEKSYTLNITANDKYSGVAAVSVNGGKKWHKLANGEVFTYTAKSKKTIEAGSILVRDVAGNVYTSDEEFELDVVEDSDEEEEAEDGDDDGGGGGGGGDGTGTPKPSHASGDGEEGSEYDALMLELDDGPMERLTVDGEPMDLTLSLEAAQEADAPVGRNQMFTASLRRWNGSDGDESPDTLLLSADLAPNLGDQFTYDWRFNGEVYRLLANSGIKYVALEVGDSLAAFPTEGFTGGTKYTELKMRGVSTRRFDYTVSMKVNLDPGHVSAMSDSDYSQVCDLSIHTEVEDVEYELSSSPNSIMYFYNVYLGPEDMLNQPFGQYRAHS